MPTQLLKYINKITQGDCIRVMNQIPDNCIDVTFADPPFNLKKDYSSYKDNREEEEYLSWSKEWLSEMVRITKPTGSIIVHNLPRWLISYGTYLNEIADFKSWIAWNAVGKPSGTGLMNTHYGFLYYAKNKNQHKFYDIRGKHKRCRKCGYLVKEWGGKKKYLHPYGTILSDVWTDISRVRHKAHQLNPLHPNQLPLPLMERIILMSTEENDIVLDPFSGTGSTALAAKRLGRNYIGIEIDPQYVDIAMEIIKADTIQSKIGDSWVSFYLGELVTIRDTDWGYIKQYFNVELLDKPADTDYKKIGLKERYKKCF